MEIDLGPCFFFGGGDVRNEKFMLPVDLDFLLDYALLTNNDEVLKHVELTLDKMAMGASMTILVVVFSDIVLIPNRRFPILKKCSTIMRKP